MKVEFNFILFKIEFNVDNPSDAFSNIKALASHIFFHILPDSFNSLTEKNHSLCRWVWSVSTKRASKHKENKKHLDELDELVSLNSSPKKIFDQIQNSQVNDYKQRIKLSQVIAIGFSQETPTEQNESLCTESKLAFKANFLAGFQSHNPEIQRIAYQALKNLARDYRRCGYTSEWYLDILLDITKDMHKYADKLGQDQDQLVQDLWLNDPIILEKLKPEIDAYQQTHLIHRIFQRVLRSFL